MSTFPNDTHASAHFTWRELSCKCGKCRLPAGVKTNLAKLAVQLEALRALVGAPLHVHSAYRCAVHNAQVGGAKDSMHMRGIAADITTKAKSPAQLANLAETIHAFKMGGIGRYPGFTHVDVRGYNARW